ncbi:alpha-D-ribose 1-methylphosphonate 5-triphosphate diphosphatase [Lachnospiraceae bacterium]|jgi:alpha-D-ribose 1-methylphosphonate 5-triphosphate diphosphatase|uniref:alpha-D-ribose 1-methylphosphonate 5-triphosphate diphosphatase n=1 Tax=Thomasclavelia cocleata TaxID=69824 RepID=UPI001362FAC4|nr:alpha-D-ribose 1-methylphosphonate 5-triphosphate diphosphatase [Thomasclavelia cocleata]NBI61262.1 alpha-D-ribose 1-methylphosphonate 5-triphosphate diphosphatase [Lachnospiraceae bacterium]
MIIIQNGKIVTDDKVLDKKILIIEKDRIAEIADEDTLLNYKDCTIINAEGGYVMPGLIDIHSDVIETSIVPRKGLIFDYTLALVELDKQLMNQGITTMYHSVSIANSTICNRNRTLSVPQMLEIGNVIYNTSNLLINHRFHARLELNTPEAVDVLVEMMNNGKVHELSLMDHTPGQGQYSDMDMFKKEIQKQYGNISFEKQEEIIAICQKKVKLSDNMIQKLVTTACKKNISMAYHDVENVDQLKWMKNNNISICEFPLNLDIAKKAIEKGMYCIVGAPNIIKEKSHNNNLSAIKAIQLNAANIVCSDYYSSGLLCALFQLAFKHGISLPKVISLATLNPAKALNISNSRGSISPGKYADIIIAKYNHNYNLPILRYVLVEGRIVSALGYM